MATHINAYKQELLDALTRAEGAVAEVRTKYQAFVAKLDEPVEDQPNPHAQGMAASPLVDTSLQNAGTDQAADTPQSEAKPEPVKSPSAPSQPSKTDDPKGAK